MKEKVTVVVLGYLVLNNMEQTPRKARKDLLFFVTTTAFLVLSHGPVNQIERGSEECFKEDLMLCRLIETRPLTCRRVLVV